MLLNPWAIVLLVTAGGSLFLVGGSLRTAVRVLRHWQPGSDSARQIDLENQTWLAALLVEYGLILQLVSLFLLLLAADNFSRVLVGAMCATGAFLANPYGIPALFMKMAGLFFSGYWLVAHRLDLSSEHLPLTRAKFVALLLLAPLVAVDSGLTAAYLLNLSPEIITSCCGVLFAPGGAADGYNLLEPMAAPLLLSLFYGLGGLLFAVGLFLFRRPPQPPGRGSLLADIAFACGQLLFFSLSLVVITVVISPYVYAMPNHRCPFDLLAGEYGHIGYPLYLSLLATCFAGSSAAVAAVCRHLPGLAGPAFRYRRAALRFSLVMLPLFLLIASWSPAFYLLAGGER